jgi:zinc/manganese transport system substrate-binding protein
VAAENFYGDIAHRIGGADVTVTSILSNPNQDPHLFEASPSVAREVSRADIVIMNGLAYDPWMDGLLQASPSRRRTVITVAELLERKAGDNPHLWYDPKTMPRLAEALVIELTRRDPARADFYRRRQTDFLASLAPLERRVDDMKAAYEGAAITATEPVFGYMAQALGLTVLNEGFQLAVMNGTEPSARQMAAFDNDLRERKAKVLIYNVQVSNDMTARLLALAKASDTAVVGVTETMPEGTGYVQWMLQQLVALQAALTQAGK